MNTRLESLFEKYNLSEKDMYEIRQIYNLLPVEKQKKLINNFDVFIHRLQRIEEEMQIERNILIGEQVSIIRDKIEASRKNITKIEIDFLKKEI